MKLLSAMTAIALGWAAFAGCTDGLPEIVVKPDAGAGGGAIEDAGTDDAGLDGGPDASGTDAGQNAVLFGIHPTPTAMSDAPTNAEILEGELASVAAGARVRVLTLPWNELDDDALAKLAAQSAFYAEQGTRIFVRLGVVERAKDQRPAGIANKAWDDPQAFTLIEGTLDAIADAAAPDLAYVTFGSEVDLYLASHEAERTAFTKFAKHACTYAQTLGASQGGFFVGVGFSFEGAKSDPTFQELFDVEDVVALSYFPGQSGASDAGPNVASDVTAMVALAEKSAIVLEAAGYTSDEAGGGSEEKQGQFWSSLVAAITAQRASFLVVNAWELTDAPAAWCAERVANDGAPPDGPFAAYVCHLGLHRSDGTPKPAWEAVLKGAAALSEP